MLTPEQKSVLHYLRSSSDSLKRAAADLIEELDRQLEIHHKIAEEKRHEYWEKMGYPKEENLHD